MEYLQEILKMSSVDQIHTLIMAEDLHRELIDLDDRIAESHAVLKDLAEQDGQNLELHIADRSPKIFSSTVSTEEDKDAASWLHKFMQDNGMREMMVLDSSSSHSSHHLCRNASSKFNSSSYLSILNLGSCHTPHQNIKKLFLNL